MTDLLLIAISVAVSLVVDITVDLYLLKSHKIGSEDYKNSLKFACKNKSIINQQDIIGNMSKKISELENQLNYLSANPKIETENMSELKKEITALKNAVNNSESGNSKYNHEMTISALNELAKRITQLEARKSVDVPPSVDVSVFEHRIAKLNNEITSLKDMISVLKQSSLQNNHIEQLIRQHSDEINSLKAVIASQQQTIQSLKSEKKITEVKPVQVHNAVSVQNHGITSVQKAPVTAASRSIIPDEDYVRTLLEKLSEIKDNLGNPEYDYCRKAFQNILNNGDFDDGEEIIGAVHGTIKKYIYGSDTKVSASDWIALEKYIEEAGYVEIPVKVGDDITPYKSYFERPIPASGGAPNTIKQVQQKPFVLTYEDCGEKETIKLCGKCTYYK